MKSPLEIHADIERKINDAIFDAAKHGAPKLDVQMMDKVLRPFLHLIEDAHTGNELGDADDFIDSILSACANMMGEVVVRTVEKNTPMSARKAEDRGQQMINKLSQYFIQNLKANFLGQMPETERSVLKLDS